MNVQCENLNLIFTNRICCFNNKSIKLQHNFDNDNILSLVFNFNYDNEKTSYKISSPDGKSIVFDLFNFNNILGTGLKQPIEIANYKGKKLFAIFFVYKHKDANPILDISLYQEM